MQKDNIKQILDLLETTEKLKQTKRYLDTPEMTEKESSADHSWHLALMTFIVAGELELEVDVLKSVKMALVHDLVEAIAGDTDYSLVASGKVSVAAKHKEELAAIEEIRKIAPPKTGEELYKLWLEYEEAKTPEAKFVKAMDKLEGNNHMICKGHTCFDHPELVALYPMKAVLAYPELTEMYQEHLDRLKPEFEKHGWEWKEEYDISK